MKAPALLRMTAPLRENFDIPYHDIGPRDAQPRLALVAGIHGDEVNGVFVLSRLAAFLRGVANQEHPGQALQRRVIIVPAVNVLGLNLRSRRWPFDGTDINRMFPGYDAGETTQRIARAVLELTRAAHYRVDIHSSNLDFEEVPQVRLYEPNDGERETARCFGLAAIIERPMNRIFTSTLGHAWRDCGGENFVIQVGQAGVLQPWHCERLFRALVGFLTRTEVLQGTPLADEDEDTHYFGVHHTLPLISPHAGLFVSRHPVGRWLQAGEVIGQVYDGFEGELQHEITTPVAGMLSGIRRQPLLFEGDLIARIQSRLAVAEAVDTYLEGKGQ
jgi:predicted deacylase